MPRLFFLIALFAPLALADDLPVPDAARNAKGLDSALNSLRAPTRDTKPLPPDEALKHFKLRPGYAIDLISAEPTVRQPLNINFDARGRMWVTQYVQYPFPKGLKVVEYDRYIRAKFDKTPLPPPAGDRGADRVTIHEDTDGDGTYDHVKTFVDGLSIATAALPGKDGVWVMNPPYLLFYPDANHDDVPDANPVVHLSGFGLEDTHAAANSLTWGPDGWIYGAQGSTCTAKVKVELPSSLNPEPRTPNPTTDFLGQAIWRYHPDRHVFEIFAEGGGNTFGVEFDDAGRCFSGTNFGVYRGVHYVQGGYYVKSWGKHGALTNPYAFGFFEHMPHKGDATRLVHTFSVYGGGLMPELTGKLIGPNPLQSRIQVTRREPAGSTFKTVEEEPLLTTDDGWFRPVDLKVGPDGAIYVCDFYENRISHVDPRDTWDRTNGRIWRIRPADWKPVKAFNFATASAKELGGTLMADPNRQVRWTALRVATERPRDAVFAGPIEYLRRYSGPDALGMLWAADRYGELGETLAIDALGHPDPSVRRWCVRLLGDRREALPSPVASRWLELAIAEDDPEVRSQLASSLKRLPGDQALPILREMLGHGGDAKDPHIPLLLWWAIERHLHTHRDAVVAMLGERALWESPLVRNTVGQRVARWLAASGDHPAENQRALVTLLAAVPGKAERQVLLAGVNEAFEGRPLGTLVPELTAALAASGNADLAVRAGDRDAVMTAVRSIADDGQPKDRRIKTIELLGQVGPPEAAAALLDVARSSKWHSVRKAALGALTRFNDPAIGKAIVEAYRAMPSDQGVRPAAIGTLLARKAWAIELLRAVDAGTIPKADVSIDQLARLRQFNDAGVAGLMQKVFGETARPTSEQKVKEIARVKSVVVAGPGDTAGGKLVFAQRCAACHVLFKEGGAVGPDLTPYERRNLDFLLVSIVDPSAAIREEYTNFRIDTADDQTFVGLIKDRGPDSVTIVDATQQRTVIPKRDVQDERALTTSIMPEGLLDGLTGQQLRDLFAYLQK
jgi:putative membrane-bound dehydrogenase-like protein